MRAGRDLPEVVASFGAAPESRSGHTPSWLGDADPAAVCHRAKFKQKEEEEEGEEVENPLLVPLEEKSVLEERQTSLWFGKVSPTGPEMTGRPWPQQLLRSALCPLTCCSLSPGCLRWHRGRCGRGPGAGAVADVG